MSDSKCFFVLMGMHHTIVACSAAWIPSRNILDVERFILAECDLMAIHSGPLLAYLQWCMVSGDIKLDMGKYIMPHMFDTACFCMQRVRLWLKSRILGAQMTWARV